jgi:predicted SnoaL-like aldol condensation-catalyzing enzyme
MSLAKNEAIIRKLVEAFNKKDLSIIDEIFSSDYIDHTNQLQGREAVKQFYAAVFKDFPNFHRTIEDMVIKGDKVWVRYKTTSTTTTGERFEIPTITITRIINGKIVENWGGVIQKMSIPKVEGELIKKLR